jgi:thiol-disulfide isomerase/thioredoxin
MVWICAAIIVLCAAKAQAESPKAERPKIGAEIANLRFKDIRYLPRSLRDFGEPKATVIVFSNTSCPLVQRYWPKLKRLDETYRDHGVQFVSMNASEGDEIADIAKQALEYGVEFPFVKDSSGACMRALGVERTPEVVILDAQRKLRYRGRIDDQYRLGGARPNVANNDLEQALEEILAGKQVSVSETPVDGCLITPPSPPSFETAPTFYKDILPLLQANCQECHRKDGGGPFALTTRDDVAAHAEMIAEVVADRRMPPWYAHRDQRFSNERGLTATERDTIIHWATNGQPAGDPSQAPPPREFPKSDWEIGTPDLITTAVETHELPAEGFVDYKYVILPHVFLQETWISAAEIKPSNPGVVHHCNMAYATVGQKFDDGNFITGRVPGGTAMTLDDGIGFRIPAGSVLGLQIHYTTTGKPERNRMSVGLKFPRGTIRQELHHEQVTTSRIEIPAGASSHPVRATRTLPSDATGIGMFSHMHLRGKDMTFRAFYPSGEEETLLVIPNYHYDWQQNYRWQPGTKKFPAGTKIEVTAHFDNSKFNPFNPDANVNVRHGPQTIHEMMFGFFFYTKDGEDLGIEVDPKTGHRLRSAK